MKFFSRLDAGIGVALGQTASIKPDVWRTQLRECAKARGGEVSAEVRRLAR